MNRNSGDPMDQEAIFKRIHRELIDAYDEELEMEAEDRLITEPGVQTRPEDIEGRAERRAYFRELFPRNCPAADEILPG